jgi:hypothetical protein
MNISNAPSDCPAFFPRHTSRILQCGTSQNQTSLAHSRRLMKIGNLHLRVLRLSDLRAVLRGDCLTTQRVTYRIWLVSSPGYDCILSALPALYLESISGRLWDQGTVAYCRWKIMHGFITRI